MRTGQENRGRVAERLDEVVHVAEALPDEGSHLGFPSKCGPGSLELCCHLCFSVNAEPILTVAVVKVRYLLPLPRLFSLDHRSLSPFATTHGLGQCPGIR